jgi:hypothetical protein
MYLPTFHLLRRCDFFEDPQHRQSVPAAANDLALANQLQSVVWVARFFGMAEFVIEGPYEIPFEWRPGSRVLLHNEFWRQSRDLQNLQTERGCYVFAIRAGKGTTPLYVGKATRSFKQECLTPGNVRKLLDGLAAYAKGTPVLFFVRHPSQRGKTNEKQIGEIENFLIQNASIRNPNVQNVHGRKAPKWRIRGVVRSGKGKPTLAESKFRRLMGIFK